MITLANCICRLLVWIGGALILGAVFVTVGDVITRALFSVGYIGLVDVTQFAVVGFAYLAMPLTFLRRKHVAVELYDHHLGPRADAVLKLVAALLSCGVLSVLLYYGWTQASRTLRYGDVSQNVEIPMIGFWIMILSGAALSLIVCVAQFLSAALILTGLRRVHV